MQFWELKSELWNINSQLYENSLFFPSELDFTARNWEFVSQF